MRRTLPILLLALVLAPAIAARAQSVSSSVRVDTLLTGLAAPVAIEFLPDGRLLFAEQNTGQVRAFRETTGLQLAPVLTVPGVVSGGERGLLGVACDPQFPTRHYLYVYYTTINPAHIRIARFTLVPDPPRGEADLIADPASRYDLLDDIPDAAPNHNGGTVRFGADGMLYAGLGDDDVSCAAQDSSSLRGVILRMDVSQLPPGPGHAFISQLVPPDNPFAASPDSNTRLVLAMGLRNPFRVQPDLATGQIVIGDVGESLREELDVIDPPGIISLGPAASPGANFGWPYLEGTALGVHRNDCATPAPPGLAAPVFDYDRTSQAFGAAIISAGYYWYRFGPTHDLPPQESGDLFASDYYSGALYRLTRVSDNLGPRWVIAPPEPGQPSPEHWGEGFEEISDWREGPDGALWFCRQSVGFAANTGSIGRLRASATTPPMPAPPPIAIRVLGAPSVKSVLLVLDGITRRPLGPVTVTLHDLTGRVLRTWHDADLLRGLVGPTILWDGTDADGRTARAGMYVARLTYGGRDATVHIPFLR